MAGMFWKGAKSDREKPNVFSYQLGLQMEIFREANVLRNQSLLS